MSSTARKSLTPPLDSGGNPYLDGVWAPVTEEIVVDDLEVIGEIPRDLNGSYFRNGPNPMFQPRGRYHVFDGDGMLHAAEFSDGSVVYRNRWIRTDGLAMEENAGRALWPGLIERPDRKLETGWGSDGWLKDNSNTDVTVFDGRLVTTFYQCGEGYLLDPATLETTGRLPLGALGARSISAHSMVDEHSGELLFFDYSTRSPHMTYGVLSPDGKLAHHTPVELPGPRLPHTLAFTERYTVLMDLPLFWDPELLERDIHKVTFFPDIPSRFGIVERYGSGEDIRWFEAEPGYIYHISNAWEEGDEIVMDGCRIETPEPPPVTDSMRALDWGKLDTRLYRWRFDLASGETREEWRDDLFTEFPTINSRYLGRKSRYAYHVLVDQDNLTLRFEGLAKYDLESGSAEVHRFEPGCYGSESPFAPRDGAAAEDDGYLVSFVTDERSLRSELQVFDARELAAGPVARVLLPVRVPPGFHSYWAPAAAIQR